MSIKKLFAAFAVLASLSSAAIASDNSTIALAVGGYDLVSYQQGEPQKGTGHHLSSYKGNQYAFANEDNQEAFEEDPEAYLPQYGGFCAYGAALGKKFYGDPTVYEVVDGKLYLNLDSKIQGLWSEDKAKNIETADELWASIKYVPANEL
jgi:YHS domain-containing protein